MGWVDALTDCDWRVLRVACDLLRTKTDRSRDRCLSDRGDPRAGTVGVPVRGFISAAPKPQYRRRRTQCTPRLRKPAGDFRHPSRAANPLLFPSGCSAAGPSLTRSVEPKELFILQHNPLSLGAVLKSGDTPGRQLVVGRTAGGGHGGSATGLRRTPGGHPHRRRACPHPVSTFRGIRPHPSGFAWAVQEII